MTWFDENGLLHHKNYPTSDTSENEILFTSELVLLRQTINGHKKSADYKLVNSILTFYTKEKKANKRISHDNKTGLMSVYPYLDESIFKIGNRWNFHPRDIAYYALRKYGSKVYPLRLIVSVACLMSCAKPYDYRPIRRNEIKETLINLPIIGFIFRSFIDHHEIVATSGKMLAWVRMVSLNMKWSMFLGSWLIKRQGMSWTYISKIYFSEYGHPIPLLMDRWENWKL